jgi:hypothetical protein
MVATVIARPVMVSGNSDSNSPPASWRFARQPPSSLLSGGASFDPSPVAPQVPVLRPDLLQWDRRELLNIPVKNTFIEFPNHTPPFGGPAARVIRSCPPGAVDKENAAGNLPPTAELPFGEGMCGEGVCGSAGHPHDCKPCAWFHHARGCQRGDACEFCHLCPPGEIKRRKKDKYRLLREKRAVGQA